MDRVADSSFKPDREHSHERLRVIKPGRGSLKNVLQDLWYSRELLYFLTWRDVKVRYKQTTLGVLWAVLQPTLQMVVLSIVFGRVAGIARNTGGTPYPIFLYSGLLPWTFFSTTLVGCSGSVVGNAALVTKVRFPRIALPVASVAAGVVDLFIASTVLVGLMIWYHVPISISLLGVPLLVLGLSCISLGFGMVFAALTVTYRDFRYVVPFMAQIWMFLTPVIYPASIVSAKWRWLMMINPLSGLVAGFRAVFLGTRIDWTTLGISTLITAFMLLAGAHYFRATERRFADVI